jgi:type III secretion protein L
MASFIRLNPDKTVLAPATRLLKARDYQVFEQAQQILDDAQQRADAIVAGAEAEFEAEKTRGYEEGLEQARMELAEQMLDTVGRTVDYFSGVEDKVVGIVSSAVRRILGEFDDAELIVRVVHNALHVVRNQKQVTLRVHPDQEQAVTGRLSHILSGHSAISYLEVVADHRLEAGGCILETEVGVVDASVEVQLQALEKAMTARLR